VEKGKSLIMKVPCFQCFGHGFWSTQKCGVCNGTGHIDTEMVCECGRPAIEYAGDTITCASSVCHDKAIAQIPTNIDPLEVGHKDIAVKFGDYCRCDLIPGIHASYECRMKQLAHDDCWGPYMGNMVN